jgi:hypothetical protein
MGAFKTDEDELIKYFHTARIAGYTARIDRLNYAAREFHRAHPEISVLRAYKMVDSFSRPTH